MLGIGVFTTIAKVAGPAVARLCGNVAFTCTKYAPELLMGARIALTVAGTVTACKATVRAQDILDEYEKQEKETKAAIAIIREKQELYKQVQAKEPEKLAGMEKTLDENHHPLIISPSKYTQKEQMGEMAKMKAGFFFKMLRNYALPIGLFGLALVTDILGYRTFKNTIAGLALTCSSMQKVIESQKQKILKLEAGQKEAAIPVEGTVTDDEGNDVALIEQVPKEPINDDVPLFELFFGEGNANWDKDPVYTLNTLHGVQRDLNMLLSLRGFVTMNDVGTALDEEFIPRKSWYQFGWSNFKAGYNTRDEIKQGQLFRIDLGIDDPINKGKKEFILRPNVDGYIYADIPEDEGLHESDMRKGLFSSLCGKFDLTKIARR